MITLRRNVDRGHVQRDEHETWVAFPRPGQEPDLIDEHFGTRLVLDEMRISPGGTAAPHPRHGAEIVTYVHKGALAQSDSTGSSLVMYAGVFQLLTTDPRTRHEERSESPNNWAHIFRMSVSSSTNKPGRAHQERRFTAAQRHNTLCLVASPDGRQGSLQLGHDVLIFSSVLDAGHHLAYGLGAARGAWLHLVHGGAAMNGITLHGGDGVGASAEPVLSLTAEENTEILLIDLPWRPEPPGPQPRRATP